MAQYDGMMYGISKHSTFISDDKKLYAEVWTFADHGYGIRMYKDQMWVADKVVNYSKLQIAIDAAENYILGV